jgi:hypothetical protein
VDIEQDRSLRLATPLTRMPLENPDTVLDAYSTHRSFQRRLNCVLNQMRPGENIMCLGLSHPLMHETLRSAMFDKRSLLAAAAAGTRIPLARDVGFILPVATSAGLFLTLQLNTQYIACACVQTMLDWDNRLRI